METPTVQTPAVHAHLQTLQGVINRMASNSASCKTWCITIVSAILVVMADKDKGSYSVVALVPVLLFFLLDAYYLHLEKCFIDRYNTFLGRVHDGTATDRDLFRIASPRGIGTLCRGVSSSFLSFSIWPFYVTLAALCIVTGTYLLASTQKINSPPAATPTTQNSLATTHTS